MKQKVLKKYTFKDVLKLINQSQKKFETSQVGGFTALLYKEHFKKAFAASVVINGTNGNKIFKSLREAGHIITYKTVQSYLRRIFGSYGRRGRPSMYMNKDQRN